MVKAFFELLTCHFVILLSYQKALTGYLFSFVYLFFYTLSYICSLWSFATRILTRTCSQEYPFFFLFVGL